MTKPGALMAEPPSDEAQLMYAFAHDLRSCLRTMHTRVQLVQRTAAASMPEQENQWLSEAVAAGEHMSRLIGAMVNYYGVAPVPETMSLALLLRGLRIDVKETLDAAGADLSIMEGEPGIAVSRALSAVLRELIANSCKFRRGDIRAEIRITSQMRDKKNAEVRVEDNGPGVASEYLETMFKPFRRMHSGHEYPGFGLGLALCRRMATANGGSIEAMAGPGGGLLVVVSLPAVHLDNRGDND